MTFALVAALLLVAVSGTAVVLTRDPLHQAVVQSFFGLALAAAFLLLQAPGVAMAIIVVGVVAVPVMVLVTMANVRGGE